MIKALFKLLPAFLPCTDALWECKARLWMINTATSRLWLLFHCWKMVYFASIHISFSLYHSHRLSPPLSLSFSWDAHTWMQGLTFSTYVREGVGAADSASQKKTISVLLSTFPNVGFNVLEKPLNLLCDIIRGNGDFIFGECSVAPHMNLLVVWVLPSLINMMREVL